METALTKIEESRHEHRTKAAWLKHLRSTMEAKGQKAKRQRSRPAEPDKGRDADEGAAPNKRRRNVRKRSAWNQFQTLYNSVCGFEKANGCKFTLQFSTCCSIRRVLA